MKKKWTVEELIALLNTKDKWAQVVIEDADTKWTITDFDLGMDNKGRVIILPSGYLDMGE